ncbi:aminotransferase class IV [Luteimonas sp. MJ174]|uniref:aminotransferase class IV n=1 Tax=Luteimonas sp. MJ174 TaxID=3129237 RepID=UPI0031BA5E86
MSEGLAAPAEYPVDAGHFTSLQMRGDRVQGRDLHLLRLRHASQDLWRIGTDKGRLRREIRNAFLQCDDRADCTLRICVRPAGRGVSPDDRAAVASPFRYDPSAQGDSARLLRVDVRIEPPRTVSASPLRVRSHHGLRACPLVKHLALQPQFAMRSQAQAAGYDDALLIAPDGCIAEGSFWSIAFWDGETVTWPRAPALAGVTWRLLQRELHDAGIPQRRVPVLLEDVECQRAAFAVNSSGIRDIASIDAHALPGDAGFGGALRDLLAAVPWEDF